MLFSFCATHFQATYCLSSTSRASLYSVHPLENHRVEADLSWRRGGNEILVNRNSHIHGFDSVDGNQSPHWVTK